ncbi:hypothetical protein [Microbacterium sp. zg.Y909]|uniref:hypothetical protein n=1 Tax=Microbacterium sp. zg.Y909 TaxID=2969413 RepID=UPI00214CD475|nr:hypothetical protein [Microbacterium sp. zg.Y909]MCR2826907.1 hypothetical protein [Microbacterium sp. zg.Y909]
MLSEKAQRGALWLPAPMSEAKRMLQEAKYEEKRAALQLRASRSRVKAMRARYATAGRDAPLPIEQLTARLDAVSARWLEYETDAAKALAFPQMLDSRHPLTLAFLKAQREAQWLRPASGREKVTPERFVAYRDAVHAAETTFAAAERDAQRAARAALPGVPGAPGVPAFPSRPGSTPRGTWPVPSRTPKPPTES